MNGEWSDLNPFAQMLGLAIVMAFAAMAIFLLIMGAIFGAHWLYYKVTGRKPPESPPALSTGPH